MRDFVDVHAEKNNLSFFDLWVIEYNSRFFVLSTLHPIGKERQDISTAM